MNGRTCPELRGGRRIAGQRLTRTGGFLRQLVSRRVGLSAAPAPSVNRMTTARRGGARVSTPPGANGNRRKRVVTVGPRRPCGRTPCRHPASDRPGARASSGAPGYPANRPRRADAATCPPHRWCETRHTPWFPTGGTGSGEPGASRAPASRDGARTGTPRGGCGPVRHQIGPPSPTSSAPPRRVEADPEPAGPPGWGCQPRAPGDRAPPGRRHPASSGPDTGTRRSLGGSAGGSAGWRASARHRYSTVGGGGTDGDG